MKITYDPETDTLTIRLKDVHISESDELQEGIIADYDAKGCCCMNPKQAISRTLHFEK